MKIVRVHTDEGIAYGAVEPEGVRLYKGSPLFEWESTEVVAPFDSVQLLAPVFPTKVLAIGKNYADHAAEMGSDVPDSPILFMKPATSVIGPGGPIVIPPDSMEVHHEAEVAVVIGSVARNVRAEEASSVILGYTAANDVTARDLQRIDGQWTRAKGYDTFCPLGPAIETEFDPLEGVGVICRVNGQIKQSGPTTDMVFGVAELIEYITRIMTLLPGDVILTGTPSGVGPIVHGDVCEVEVESIGVLSNPVVKP